MDTIFVLNSNKQVIDVLSNNGSNPSAPFFDDIYKAELDTGAETYEFTTLGNPRTCVTLEVGNYVLFKYNGKYKLCQIMETTDEHTEGKKLLTCYCEMAGMELLNDYCEPFSIEGNFITFLNTVLQDTNWQVGLYSASLLDNIQMVSTTEPENVYSLIQNNLATFGGVEVEFRVEFVGNQLVAMLIDCYESGTRGNRTHRRFEYGKDIKGITRNRNIADLATAVIGVGKNGLDFKDIEWDKNLGNPCDKPLQQNFVVDIEANDIWNNGGKYIKTVYKSDAETAQDLLQETWDYLQEIKQPKFDYDVDLALVAEDYLDINVGDTNYVLDFDYQPAILLEARVGTLELSFADPRNNKCTLTNYKELTSILQRPIDLNTVGNMIQSKFPIGGEDIAMGAIGEGHIEVTYYQAIKTDIMNATLANVDTLIADLVDTEQLNAVKADIETLRANDVTITGQLTATNGNITILNSQVANIQDLIAGNTTTGDLQTIHLTADNATIDDAVIKNAMIDTVSGNKVNTGTLNTNNVNIESEDGGIKISGTTQQFKDKEGHVRVQIGKDAQGNFTFCLFSQDGVGILLDETGIKAGAVPDGLIVNDMVSDSANISGSKLDISSVITQINNNETTINSSHIKFDDTGQSLLVAFNQLKNQVDTIEEVTIGGDLSAVIEKVNTHTTQIGVMQGQISSLIENTTITKQDGTVVQLKDEYNSTKDTVNSHTTKIGTLESNYNKVSGDLESVTSKQSTLEQTLDEVSSTLTQTTTTANAAKTQASSNKQTIDSMSTTLTQTTKTANEAKTQASTNKQSIDSMSTTLTQTTTTANNALNKATTAQQNLDGFKTTVSNTYTTKTDFNNLSIGGRNLVKNSNFVNGIANWNATGAKTMVSVDSSFKFNGHNTLKVAVTGQTSDKWTGAISNKLTGLKTGDIFTISCWYYVGDKSTFNSTLCLELKGKKVGDSSESNVTTSTVATGDIVQGKWTRLVRTTKLTSDYEYMYVYPWVKRNGTAWFADIKLEKGNKATDWTPAPEDIDDKFTKYSTTTQMNSAITQKANEITSSVSSTYVSKTDANNTYATKSLVTQTANDVRFEFKHQGTANLQYNGGGNTYNHDGWFAYKAWWYYDNSVAGYVVNSEEGSGCVQAPFIYCNPNTTYSVKVHVCPEANTGDFWVAVKEIHNDDNFHYQTVWNTDTTKGWHTVRATFTTGSDTKGFYIELWSKGKKSNTAAYVTFFSELMVFQGAEYYPDVYVPYIGAINSADTTVNANGVTISIDGGGSTNINTEGLTIYNDNGSKRAWFGQSNSAYIDTITTNKIIEPSLLRNSKGCGVYHLYCAPNATGDGTGRDSNNRANSIYNALEWFRSTYGTYLWQTDLYVHLANGDYWGASNYIGGWLGTGTIQVVFDEWACLRTTPVIEENTVTVYLMGSKNAWDYNTQNNAYIYVTSNNIVVRHSMAIFGGLNIQKEGWGGDLNTWTNYDSSCFCLDKGSVAYVANCDVVGYYNGFYLTDNSRISIVNCRGHNYRCGDARAGSLITYAGKCWKYAEGTYLGEGSQHFGGFSSLENSWFKPKPDAPYTPPAVTENWQWTENTFNATSLWTTPEGSGSGTTARSGCWGQGNWSSYKAHRGHASFDGVNAWCNGGRNFSAYITMHRLSSNHGNAGATPVPKFVRTDGASWSCGQAFARGDTKTIQLPWEVVASLIQGGTNELQLWAGKSTSDYSFYDNVSLRIVCEKNFI